MKRVSKMKVGTQLLITFGILMLEILVVAGCGYLLRKESVEIESQLYEKYGQAQEKIAMGFAEFQEVKVKLRNILYMYTGEDEKVQDSKLQLEDARGAVDDYMQDIKGDLQDSSTKSLYEKVQENIDAYFGDVDKCLEYYDKGYVQEARNQLLDSGVKSADEAEENINKLIEELDKCARDKQTYVTKRNRNGDIFVAVILLLSLLNAIVACIYILRTIRNPIVDFSVAAKKIADGDVDIEIKPYNIENEVGALVDGFNAMVDNLKNQANALKQISEGNLTVSYKPKSERDVVGNAIVRLIEDNNVALSNIRNAANQISNGSEQIASASQTLAQGSSEQASAIQQISASITDIANKTKDNAQKASEVNDIVMHAKEDADNGNRCMKDMIKAMKEINESSENIQKIIKVIDDIAFNTNILALNATVEAARAGEQGKGFAVVAEEVRNLAGRSAEASRQTAEMIEDSISKVKQGSVLVDDTANALAVIAEMIEKINELSENITSASNEQAVATSQIDDALAQVSQVVQTNSATSEECASASEELSGQARGLDNTLTRFKIKDGQQGMGIGIGYAENLYEIPDAYNNDIRLETSYDTKY